jgi:predicted ribosomally synthesized peptide with SipW-like signal peptide
MRDNITRRSVLGTLGIGGASAALGGIGTEAFFSDQETFTDNRLVAGELDMKVLWEEHYADWMGAETEFARMPDDDEEPNYVLPAPEGLDDGQDIELVIDNFIDYWSATAVEAFPDTDNDGERDLLVNGPMQEPNYCERFTDVGANDPGLNHELRTTGTHGGQLTEPGDPLINLTDVKPGDFGEVTLGFVLCDNPGYVWLNGELIANTDNGINEPEASDPDEPDTPHGGTPIPGSGELADAVQTRIWYDNGNNILESSEMDHIIFQGSLSTALSVLGTDNGIPLDNDTNGANNANSYDEVVDDDGTPVPAAGNNPNRNSYDAGQLYFIGLEWWLPVDHGNQYQTDRLAFDLGLYTEQERHNDGRGLTPEATATPTATETAAETGTDTT